MSAGTRKLLLRIFRHINPGDITIRHHWTLDKLVLHSFTHKGYWFYGRRRNREVLERFPALVARGDCVLDVGGHIGYTALYLSYLVGMSGQVYVFEPSPANLTYLRRNAGSCSRANITVVAGAVSDTCGPITLYSDAITGQNSTIMPEFCRRHLGPDTPTYPVPALTVDQFVSDNCITPRFIKVDAEGAEAQILKGMIRTMNSAKPRLMLEVSLSGADVQSLLDAADYQAYTIAGRQIERIEEVANGSYVFAFHRSDARAAAQLH